MTKKSFIAILVAGIIITYLMAVVDFVLNISTGKIGLPFGFASFNLLGGSTDSLMLFLNIIFWFVIVLLIWKIVLKK